MDVSTTTKAVTLPDETWALIERLALFANSPRDNMITRLANEGSKAMAERWPTTFGTVVSPKDRSHE
jgi:hypothetical protein